mmetsp:Transcript_4225/g.7190  ORF Transcript_4225/g.7190 Transcript_4225/m.7190 type:complete len:224 (-) Transcript_4225:95-766(-)
MRCLHILVGCCGFYYMITIKLQVTRVWAPLARVHLSASGDGHLGILQLLHDALGALLRDGGLCAEVVIVSLHGVHGAVHVPVGGPARDVVIPAVLGHPVVGGDLERLDGLRPALVLLAKGDGRQNLVDQTVGHVGVDLCLGLPPEDARVSLANGKDGNSESGETGERGLPAPNARLCDNHRCAGSHRARYDRAQLCRGCPLGADGGGGCDQIHGLHHDERHCC